MQPFSYDQIPALLSRDESAALCTVLETHGSAPRHAGSKMLVFEDGSFSGTVGGGMLESRVLTAAREVIESGGTRLLAYSLTDLARGDPGVCGGQVLVFVEALQPPPTLVVIGAGHVGKAVAHLAKWLGFRVAVSDDRVEFCTPQVIPAGQEFYPAPMAQLPAQLKITRHTWLVLTTRGSPVDVAGLPALLETSAAYIGVIGSRRRWAETVKGLKAAGVSEKQIARIHSPLGIDIHAETPEEIAVSILAEIISLRGGEIPAPEKAAPPAESAPLRPAAPEEDAPPPTASRKKPQKPLPGS